MSTYQPHSEPLRVRTDDVDAWDQLRTSSILSYLEQVALDASAVAGFGTAWYEARQTAWVVRKMRLQRLGPADYGDRLVATTWISTIARVRANREYELRHGDGRPVAVAEAEWAYIDRVRWRPIPVDPEISALLPPLGPSPLLTPTPVLPAADCLPPHEDTRRARRHETDSMGHINNAIYADWLEEAAGDALPGWGYGLAAPATPGLRLALRSLVITYVRSALPGDTITITTIRSGADPATGQIALAQEITRGDPAELLVQAETVYDLVGAAPAGEAPAPA
jgi:medium-chain acyl-[acyl-carrier-protein] hydrolase